MRDARQGGATVGAVTNSSGMRGVQRRPIDRPDSEARAACDGRAARGAPRRGRPPKHDLKTWRVIDDWPDVVPVTLEEVAVYERWFGDVLDELFGNDAPDDATAGQALGGSGQACRDPERK